MTASYFKKQNGYEIDGIWYPRVTSICKIIAKPGLERWLANQQNFFVMQKRRQRVVDWGRTIHDTVEKILLGRMPKIDNDIYPSIEAFLKWFKKHRIDIFGIEKRVLSRKHLYSGTLDVFPEIDGKLGVLDIKTSKEIWDDHFIQTAAYFQAINEEAKRKAKTFWILKIDQYQECKLCGARKRQKLGEMSIEKNKRSCNHKWLKAKGECELREAKQPKLYVDTFLNAKSLWEFSNREILAQIDNYPKDILRKGNKQLTWI